MPARVAGRVYAYPSSGGEPVYRVRGAYVDEYPNGPAVFVVLDDVWYDCTAPCEPRFVVRDGFVYAHGGTGEPKDRIDEG